MNGQDGLVPRPQIAKTDRGWRESYSCMKELSIQIFSYADFVHCRQNGETDFSIEWNRLRMVKIIFRIPIAFDVNQITVVIAEIVQKI